MIIVTTEGPVEVWSSSTSLDRVVLAATNIETLKSVSQGIELAGKSEDVNDFCTTTVYKKSGDYWTLLLDRTTFKLWLMFEAEHYARYNKGDFVKAARTDEIKKTIEEIQKEIGTYEKSDG